MYIETGMLSWDITRIDFTSSCFPHSLQINVVNDRKEYLERKISMLVGEREGLSCNLDETSEKIIVLERHNREQETKVTENRI